MKKSTYIIWILSIVMACYRPGLAASYGLWGFSDISADSIFYGLSPGGEVLLANTTGSYLWTPESGLVYLSNNTFSGLGNGSTYSAETISNGASVVIGSANNTAARWTPNNGMKPLYELMNIEQPNLLLAESVSANGVIVGRIASEDQQGQWSHQAFCYNEAAGYTHFFGPTLKSSGAYGVSADGSIVTGTYEQNPFWWTQEQGMQFLDHPDIPFLYIQDDRVSEVFDVSDNGRVMAGWSGSPFESVATIWDLDGDTIILSDVENNSFATSVSGDGRIVVGHEYLHEVPNHRIAFIWDEINGKQYLNDFLTNAGIDLAGWHLAEAQAISSDGRMIIGRGTNPAGVSENWIVTIPEPATAALLILGALRLRKRRK